MLRYMVAIAKIEGEAFKFVLVRKECFNSPVYSWVFFHPSKRLASSDSSIRFSFHYEVPTICCPYIFFDLSYYAFNLYPQQSWPSPKCELGGHVLLLTLGVFQKRVMEQTITLIYYYCFYYQNTWLLSVSLHKMGAGWGQSPLSSIKDVIALVLCQI